jgi:Phosphotransferase enzyme family
VTLPSVREELLPGNVTAGVVRVGDTVRRPAGPWTHAVDALLAHLHPAGFPGAPRPLGRDAQGRQVLEYVPGRAGEPGRAHTPAQLRQIGRMLRDYHRAVADFHPPTDAVWNCAIPPDDPVGAEIICHGDPAPWNLVDSPRGWVLIDWDGAGPGTALCDLAYAAHTTVPLEPGRDPAAAAAGLRAIADGYDLDEAGRRRLARPSRAAGARCTTCSAAAPRRDASPGLGSGSTTDRTGARPRSISRPAPPHGRPPCAVRSCPVDLGRCCGHVSMATMRPIVRR